MNPGGGSNDIYNQIGPGFAAFVVIFGLALAVWFLVKSMNGHLRTVRYQQADEAAREQGTAEAGQDRVDAADAGGTAGRRADRTPGTSRPQGDLRDGPSRKG